MSILWKITGKQVWIFNVALSKVHSLYSTWISQTLSLESSLQPHIGLLGEAEVSFHNDFINHYVFNIRFNKGKLKVLHHYRLGVTDWTEVLQRRTWRSWWTSWPWPINVLLWQVRPTTTWAELGRTKDCRLGKVTVPFYLVLVKPNSERCVQFWTPQKKKDMDLLESTAELQKWLRMMK